MIKKGQILALLLIFIVSATSTIGLSATAYATEGEEKQEEATGQKQEEGTEQILTDKDDIYWDALKNVDKPYSNIASVDYNTINSQQKREALLYFSKYKEVMVPDDYGPVRMVKMLVEEGSTVKKGTPVAEISTSVDEVALARITLELKRMQEAYQRFIASQNKSLQEQRKVLNTITDKQDRRIAALKYDKSRFDFESNKKSQYKQIEAVKEEIKKSKEIKNTKQLVAPVDGYVISVSNPGEGKVIESRKSLMRIADISSLLFQVKDMEAKFWYNMNVTLTLNENGTDEQTITGKVVTSAYELFEQRYSTAYSCYIKPDEPVDLKSIQKKNISAIVDYCNVTNALVVPIEAVDDEFEADRNTKVGSAYALVDGNLVEKHFVYGIKNDKYYQVINGLNKGDQVILNSKQVER